MENNLENKNLYKETLTLLWPIALQNLLTLSISISDNFFSSKISEGAISAIFLGGQMQILLQFLAYGISGVVLVLASQNKGAGKREAVSGVGSFGILLSLLLGLVFMLMGLLFPREIVSFFAKDTSAVSTAADYLKTLSLSFPFFAVSSGITAIMRSIKKPKIPFVSSGVALFVNVSLNFLLIFGKLGLPALGTAAIGISAVTARVIECAVLVVYLFFFERELKITPRVLFSLDMPLIGKFFKSGYPIILGQVVWGVGNLFSTLVISRKISTLAVAALSLAGLMHNLSYIIINALSATVGTIFASLVGAGREDEATGYAHRAELIFLSLGITTGILIFLSKGVFVSLYSLSGEGERIALSFLSVLSVTVVGTSYQSGILYGVLRGGGMIKFVFWCDLFFVLLVGMPYAFSAAEASLAPWIAFAALKSDQILKCIPAFIRMRSGKSICEARLL